MHASAATIRAFSITDYRGAHALWLSTAGLGLTESDTEEAIGAFLERNPGFSAVAECEGVIVGSVLCGHNGRIGSLHHLAVAENSRRQGIGHSLVDYALAKLSAANIPRCNVFVYNDNVNGNDFWLGNGWIDPTTWRVLQKRVLPPQIPL